MIVLMISQVPCRKYTGISMLGKGCYTEAMLSGGPQIYVQSSRRMPDIGKGDSKELLVLQNFLYCLLTSPIFEEDFLTLQGKTGT